MLFKSGSSVSPSAGAAGDFSNPYFLYLPATKVSAKPLPLTATVSGNKLTLAFTAPVLDYPGVFHAHQTTPSADALKRQFTVSGGVAVSGIDFSEGNVVLTLGKTYAYGEAGPTVMYAGNSSTDGIGFMNTDLVPTTLDAFGATTATNITPAPPPPPPPTPSSATMPSNVRTVIGGATYRGERTGETFTITVPNGTDISSLDIAGNLPTGAKSDPKLPAKHNFNDGPFTLVMTAEDGTEKTYTINVVVESPDEPTEKQYFTFNVNDCEVVATQNADGTWSVKIRLPFGQGADPALLAAVKAYLTNLGLTDLYYSWVDAQGNATPVTALKAAAPYLEIGGIATNRDAFKNGAITSIQYMLKNDPTIYVQTFANGGIKIADMPGFPQESPSGGGSSSSCDAGFGAVAVAVMMMGVVGSRKRK